MSAQSRWNKRNPQVMRKATADWRRRNPEKVKAANARPFRGRFGRYGLTVAGFHALAARQKGRCAGCNRQLEEGRRTHVDHDHSTGKVRGLLCNGCNTALGFMRESAATAYQLSAYLELDRTRPVVYLIGSLRNPEVVNLGNEIRSRGFECVENWFAAGPTADDSWQAYSNARGRSYTEALQSREAKHVFHFDRAYLHLADAVVLLYPAGRSAHLEFGYAVGQGKKGYLLMEQPAERYDVMLQFSNSPLFNNREEMLAAMRSDFPATMGEL